MRAIAFATFGEPEVLHLVESARPEPGPGQLLVRVASAGVNPIDWKTRRGLGFVAERIHGHLPWTPGYDIAGEVVQAGPGVSRWEAGARVMGLIGFPWQGGGYASYVLVGEDELVAAPERLELAGLGAVPLAALTAWQGLFDHGRLQAGERVLIHGGAGGVGHFAVQMARAVDAHVMVTASGHNGDFVKSLGADEVLDYEQDDFVEECYGLDLVLDLVGGETGIRSLHALGEGGRLVTVPTNTAAAILEAAEARGQMATNFTVRPDNPQLDQIAEMLDVGEIRVHIEADYPLGDASAAHRRLETGHGRGKLVLHP